MSFPHFIVCNLWRHELICNRNTLQLASQTMTTEKVWNCLIWVPAKLYSHIYVSLKSQQIYFHINIPCAWARSRYACIAMLIFSTRSAPSSVCDWLDVLCNSRTQLFRTEKIYCMKSTNNCFNNMQFAILDMTDYTYTHNLFVTWNDLVIIKTNNLCKESVTIHVL